MWGSLVRAWPRSHKAECHSEFAYAVRVENPATGSGNASPLCEPPVNNHPRTLVLLLHVTTGAGGSVSGHPSMRGRRDEEIASIGTWGAEERRLRGLTQMRRAEHVLVFDQ